MRVDKLHRTSLMHAAMNGHAHVVSYFLNLGVGMDQADTSGNTTLHYAVGYGWYYCTKILLDAGADPAVVNDWKVCLSLLSTYFWEFFKFYLMPICHLKGL